MDQLCTRPWDIVTYYANSLGGRPMCQLYLSLPTFTQWTRYSAFEYFLKFSTYCAMGTVILMIALGFRKWRAITFAALRANAIMHPLCFFVLTAITSAASQSIGATLFFFFFFTLLGQVWMMRPQLKRDKRRAIRILAALLTANLISWCAGAYPDF